MMRRFVISHFLGSIFEEFVWLFLFDFLTQKFHKNDPQKIFIEANNVSVQSTVVVSLTLQIKRRQTMAN